MDTCLDPVIFTEGMLEVVNTVIELEVAATTPRKFCSNNVTVRDPPGLNKRLDTTMTDVVDVL